MHETSSARCDAVQRVGGNSVLAVKGKDGMILCSLVWSG